MGRRNTNSTRAREMRALLLDFEQSGLSAKAFALERGITTSLLWYWRRRLRQDAQAVSAARMVPVTIQSEPTPAQDLVLEVQGRRVHVPRDFDADALRRLVATLEAC